MSQLLVLVLFGLLIVYLLAWSPTVMFYDGGGHMAGWGMGMGAMMLLIWIPLLLIVIWFVEPRAAAPTPGVTEAQIRLARGEISPEDYQEVLRTIEGR